MKRTFTIAVAIAAVALAGASCSSTDTADPPATTTTETAETELNFAYIQTEYADVLNKAECPDGALALTCQGLKNSDFETLRIDVSDLPPSQNRAKVLKTLDSLAEGYDKLSEDGCGTEASFDAFCSVTNYTSNMSAETLRLQINTAATQE